MAKLTRDDILHLARLARLKLSDEEIEKLQQELGSILGYVEQLQQVDLKGLTPTTQVTGLTNVFREDEVVDYSATPDKLVKLAPAPQADNHIKVKRMVL